MLSETALISLEVPLIPVCVWFAFERPEPALNRWVKR
jgi:hypothetical protein